MHQIQLEQIQIAGTFALRNVITNRPRQWKDLLFIKE